MIIQFSFQYIFFLINPCLKLSIRNILNLLWLFHLHLDFLKQIQGRFLLSKWQALRQASLLTFFDQNILSFGLLP